MNYYHERLRQWRIDYKVAQIRYREAKKNLSDHDKRIPHPFKNMPTSYEKWYKWNLKTGAYDEKADYWNIYRSALKDAAKVCTPLSVSWEVNYAKAELKRLNDRRDELKDEARAFHLQLVEQKESTSV